MKSIAVIPARGGSKRIPHKNIVSVAGKPLIGWTIEAALDARHIDAVFVSTEDARIAQAARQFGAEVIPRPDALAQDTTGTEPVLLHALDWLWEIGGMQPESVALLQCTSPLRTSEVIDRAVEKLQNTGCDAVVGAHPTIEYFFSGELSGDHFVPKYDPQNRPRTQNIKRRYKENGSVYVTRTAFLRRTGCRMGGDTRAVIMSPTEGIDIDDMHDLMVAQAHLERLYSPAPTFPALHF